MLSARLAAIAALVSCRIHFDVIDDAPVDAPISPEAVYGTYGGGGSQIVRVIAVEAATGATAIVGAFQQDIALGSPRTSRGAHDAYIVSLTGDGRLRWVRQLGGTGSDVATGVAFDDSGDLVVTGYFSATVDFGTGPVTALGETDMFVIGLDAEGATRWVRTFGDVATGTPFGSDRAEAVAAAAGQVYVAGQFTGTVDFGTGPLAMNATGDDVFLAALDTQGATLWVKHFGGGQYNKTSGVVADPAGVAFTGYFQGSVSFEGPTHVSSGGNDVYVAVYDPGGGFRWSTTIGGAGHELGHSIAFDDDRNTYIAGYYQSTVDFGSGPVTSPGMLDAFVASYSPTGGYRWSITTQSSCARVYDVAVRGDRVLAAGSFDLDLATPSLASNGPGDAFVLELDRSGAIAGELAYGGPGYDAATAVRLLGNGDLLLAGETGGLDDCTTTGVPGQEDLYFIRTRMP